MKRPTSIGLVADPHGFLPKERLRLFLNSQGYKIQDFGVAGPTDETSVDELTAAVVSAITSRECECAIALSVSGNSFQIVANKYPQISAAPCMDEESALEAALTHKAQICEIFAGFDATQVRAISLSFLSNLTG